MEEFPDSSFSPEPLPGEAVMAWKQKKDKHPPFVAVLKEMLKSHAWEALGNASRVAYIHIKGKSFSRNPGEITLSYNEIERIMERRTFSWALRELEKFGFINRTQRGGLYRRRNFFRLSEEWRMKSIAEIQLAKEELKKVKTILRERKNSRGKNATVESSKIHTVNQENKK
jgi:DNA-binding transcriptional ArsR family regulator